MSHLSDAALRETLGHFASGVTVVTGLGANGPAGFTCQSFTSLSLSPPLVLFAVSRGSSSWPQVRDGVVVAINVLAEDQELVARTFATKGIDRFAEVPHAPGANGAPVLSGALAVIEGTVHDVHTHGDHDVVVVAVTSLMSRSGEPLVYFRSGFGTFRS